MDPKSVDLGTDHVVNISMSQEQDVNNNHDILSMSQEYVICLEKEINDLNTATQEPETNDADANTSVEAPTCERKACNSLTSEAYMEFGVPLYEAAITGDWEAAKVLLDRRPELVRFAITQHGDTMLHAAVRAEATEQSVSFMENLVEMMEIEDLEIENDRGELAYEIAAIKGNIHMFKVIVNKHKDLLSKFPEKTEGALHLSAINGHHDMSLHFYNVVEETPLWFWGDGDRCIFFLNCLHGGLFGIALKVLEGHPIIGTSFKTCFTALDHLARRPDRVNRIETDTYMIWRIADSIPAFFHVKKKSPNERDNQALELVRRLLKLYLISFQHEDIVGNIVALYEYGDLGMGMNPFGLLFTATEKDNTRFVIELVKLFPSIIYETKDGGISIFHIAIKHRNKDIYNLLYETGLHNGPLVNWVDNKHNNLLHLVAMTSNDKAKLQTVSGASLLMQRELLWYKEIEKLVPPGFRSAMNDDGKTPYELFSENNQELVSKGMKWTRDCMVVATLIITVAFAVAFTVPGGYNQETGIPILDHDTSFLVFIIADAFSLFTSSTSLLVFLSILTSPYDQRDFLYAMPGKLMIGLVALFMSVAAMMVTFAASFFVIYKNTYKWLPILISIFAATPVIIFAALQYPFVMDMYRSMFDSRYLFNTRKRVLYTKNKRL
uniref:uncharacterized protein LOC122600111 n=1 Tax=Erigeron canadensis TaxID=72917 RepID=UPI001CB956CC|nr:uncharacterized protein LOC122600111 [Erigeron canadensis]XP_043628709.1 uncharacterized protein LOC122600111 [Erigeron canadensis]